DVRPYWEIIIEERKKTLDIYEVLGENVGGEIVNEYQSSKSSKRFKCDQQEQ
ncbi:21923_t:CDS:2, partial [Gigaspora margarita]